MHQCSKYRLLIFFFLIGADVDAQFGWVENKSLGPGRIWDVVQESDGGLTIIGDFHYDPNAGAFERPNMDCPAGSKSSAIWLARLDSNWDIVWERCYGGSRVEAPIRLFKRDDTTYVIFFYTGSEDGDMIGNQRSFEVGAMILDDQGVIKETHYYGGTGVDVLRTALKTHDGGYLLGAETKSSDGDVPGYYGFGFRPDLWVVKLDSSLSIEWSLWWGGTADDACARSVQLETGEYLIATCSASEDYDLTGNVSQGMDIWLLKLNNQGKILWQKKITKGPDNDYVQDMILTSDNSVVMVGKRQDYFCDSVGREAEMWVTKVDTAGNVLWDKCFGDKFGGDKFYTVVEQDGGYILGGTVYEAGGDVGNVYGPTDYWLIQVDFNGNMLWENNIGGTSTDWVLGAYEAEERRLIGFGNSESNDYDLQGVRDSNDYTSAWLFALELFPLGINQPLTHWEPDDIAVYPNPTGGSLEVEVNSSWTGPWKVSVYNNVGHVVLESLMLENRMNIDVSHLSPGVYYIHGQWRGNEGQYFGTFILMR